MENQNKNALLLRLMNEKEVNAVNDEQFAAQVDALHERLYATAMLYMCSHSQAVDVLDEAIYKALCGYKRLRDPAVFTTWITRIVINECHNELRRQKRLRPLEDWEEPAAQAFDSLPLREAIAALPDALREIVILRYFSGFTLVETAKMLGIAQGTAASRQRKALKLLRLELEEEASP